MGSWAVTSLARLTSEEVTVCVPPAKCAIPALGLVATTQVVQVIVPLVVIVPPPIGPVVAMLVTVPLPPPVVANEHTEGLALVQVRNWLAAVGCAPGNTML